MAENTLWNTVLKRLRDQMGEESFDAWSVAYSPEFVSFDDGAFTILVQAQSEMLRTAGNEIAKILDNMGFENVVVKFVATDDTVILEAKESKDLYDVVVSPNRALYMPGYYKRWVSQELGADYGITVMSYAQGRYEVGGRAEGEKQTVRVTAERIAARAGCSVRTLRRRLVSDDFLNKTRGLLEFVKNNDWDLSSGTPHKLPSKVRVFTTMPLTPRDTARLRQWIMENIEAFDGPEGVIRAATEAPIQKLIGDGNGDLREDALTVHELLASMFKDQINPKLLPTLASALHRHIMPSKDQIKVTVFFMEHILPLVGAALGWVITLLRDRCYVDGKTNRNIVRVDHGWDEIAEACGLTGSRRAKTVYEWLKAKHPAGHPQAGKFINPILQMYVAEIVKNEPQLDFERQPRTFRVLVDEVPSEMLEAVVSEQGIVADLVRSDICTLGLAELSAHPVWEKANGASVTSGMAEMSRSNGAVVTNGMAQMALSVHAVVTVKALKLLNQTLNPNQPTPAATERVEVVPSEPEPEPAPVEQGGGDVEQPHLEENPKPSVGRSVWIFSKLTKTSDVNPVKVAEMTAAIPDEQERARRFVGWLLYAHSPKGKNLTDDTGVGNAIVSIGKNPGNAFMRLAKLGEEKLCELFDSDFARTLGEKTTEEMIYRANLKMLPLHRKVDLYFRLFGKDAPEPVAAADTTVSDGTEENHTTGNDGAAVEPTPTGFKLSRRQFKVDGK